MQKRRGMQQQIDCDFSVLKPRLFKKNGLFWCAFEVFKTVFNIQKVYLKKKKKTHLVKKI
jgi:hypothetical protein